MIFSNSLSYIAFKSVGLWFGTLSDLFKWHFYLVILVLENVGDWLLTH